MQHKYCFKVVHCTLQNLLSMNDHLFDDIPVIFNDDFAQISPIVWKGNQAAIVNVCIQWSFLWSQLCKLHLQQNMWLHNNPVNQKFMRWLFQLLYNHALWGWIKLSAYITQLWNITEFQECLFSSVKLQQIHENSVFFCNRVILTFCNDVVNDYNVKILQQMQKDLMISDSVNTADVNDAEVNYDELTMMYLWSLSSADLSSVRLCLKVKASINLLWNLSFTQRLYNSTHITVTHLEWRCIQIWMLSGDFDGQLWLLFQILLTTTASELSFILMWKQFSVHLCFAMTVNKAQGRSLQSVSVNL